MFSKPLLTIPLTQVSSEIVFSKLKVIKTRLQANLTNEHLEAFVMMSTKKDSLNIIDNETVIKRLCEYSTEMKKYLAF